MRNQNLIGKPNMTQSKVEPTINLQERKANHSTINPRNGTARNNLIASAKNEMIAKMVISKFLAIVPANPIPKKNLSIIWV